MDKSYIYPSNFLGNLIVLLKGKFSNIYNIFDWVIRERDCQNISNNTNEANIKFSETEKSLNFEIRLNNLIENLQTKVILTADAEEIIKNNIKEFHKFNSIYLNNIIQNVIPNTTESLANKLDNIIDNKEISLAKEIIVLGEDI